MIDCVYIAASGLDFRYTRICVASVRYFCPDVPIRLLIGGRLPGGLVDELRRYWNVQVADFPLGDYGWGFVKLEPLFGTSGERFLMLDSDTVMTGHVVDALSGTGADFVVDNEVPSEQSVRDLYYEWERARTVEPHTAAPGFFFNTGQWLGTAGVLTREDFTPWVEWTLPRKLRHPQFFKCGEQGALNYVLTQKALRGEVRVERRELMRWPARSMAGLDAATVSSRAAPSLVVHWAGIKKLLQRDMAGADVLEFFEREYYRRLPAGAMRRALHISRHALAQGMHFVGVRAKLTLKKYAARFPRRAAQES